MKSWIGLVLLAAGCGAAPTDGLEGGDAGPLRGGAPDAGSASDATASDAGAVSDATASDATSAPDATPALDASMPDASLGPFVPCGVVGFGTVARAVPSPDATLIALATVAREVVLVSSVDGTLVRRISAHEGAVVDVAFSADGRTLFSWGQDRHLRAWSTSDGAPLWSVRKSSGDVDVRLAVEGDEVAVGGPPVEVFDARTGAHLRSVEHPGVARRSGFDPGLVAFSRGGRIMAAAQGQTVHLFDAAGASLGIELSGDLGVVDSGAYTPDIQSIAFMPTGELLVAVRRAYFSTSGLRYPVARIYDTDDGATITTLTASSSYGVSAALSVDGARVVIAAGGAVDEWTVRAPDGRWLGESATAQRVDSPAAEVRYDARGRVIARDAGTRVRVHAPGSAAPDLVLRAGTPGDGPLVLLDDASLVRTTGGRTVETWSIAGEPARLRVVAEGVRAAAISSDRTRIAVARPHGVELLDLGAPERGALVLASTISGARALAFDPTDTVLAIAADRDERSHQRPSVLTLTPIGGAPVAYATAAGVVDQIRSTAAGWLTIGPSRDRHRGPHAFEVWSGGGALTRRATLDQEGTGLDSADVHPDGSTLLAAGWVTPLRARSIADDREIVLPAELRATRVRYAPDGSVLVRGESTGRVLLGPPDRPTEGTPLIAPGPDAPFGEIARLDVSPSSRVLAVGTVHGDTRVFCRRER